ncbi:MAG TPA: MurR/RpiR family transcriptional regulator [Azospirillum sp.]|nr:MurR/RpiR family transcriptional regulator [Azospirillum sp.]
MPESDPASSVIALMTRMQGTLSAALAKVGDWAIAYPFRAATLKIDELAAASGVSVASVNRYARALGFAGYPDFRAALLRTFDATLSPVEKLRAAVDRDTTHVQIIRESLDVSAANIRRTQEWLQPERCEEAVRLIRNARRVFVVGLGGSAYPAAFLADALEPYVDVVRECTGFAGSERMTRRLLRVRDGDLVIGITVPRYSRQTVDFIRLAKERGGLVMALTDAPSSPVVPLADVTLLAGATHSVLYGSLTGIFALTEGLGAALARAAGVEAVSAATEVTAHILPFLYTDDPAPPPRPERRR